MVRLAADKYCVTSYSIAYFDDPRLKTNVSSDNTGKRFNSEPGLQKVDLLTSTTS